MDNSRSFFKSIQAVGLLLGRWVCCLKDSMWMDLISSAKAIQVVESCQLLKLSVK